MILWASRFCCAALTDFFVHYFLHYVTCFCEVYFFPISSLVCLFFCSPLCNLVQCNSFKKYYYKEGLFNSLKKRNMSSSLHLYNCELDQICRRTTSKKSLKRVFFHILAISYVIRLLIYTFCIRSNAIHFHLFSWIMTKAVQIPLMRKVGFNPSSLIPWRKQLQKETFSPPAITVTLLRPTS